MEWNLSNEFYKYSDSELRSLNSLSIAYIGDCVYELYLRNHIMKKYKNMNSNKLHFEVIKYVNAKAQKDAYFKIKDFLSEEEEIYFKKGRNSKTKTIPKNSSVSDYKISTGFETIIGYLYITKNFERLDFILNVILEGE